MWWLGEFEVSGGEAPREDGEWRGVPHHLFDDRGDVELSAHQPREPGGVGEDQLQHPGQQIAGGGVRGDQHQAQMAEDLVVVQPGLVSEQPGGEVGARLRALALGEFPEDLHDAVVVRKGSFTALDDLGAGDGEIVPLGRGEPEQPGQHEHRQVLGVVAHQVGAALVGERVDLLVREVRDMAADTAARDALQIVGDRSAQPAMRLAVLGHAVGAPAQHLDERRGGLDASFLPVPPDARIPAELAGVVEYPPVLPVAEDQPGRDVALEEYRRQGPVLLAQPSVDAVRVECRVRPVQTGEVVGAAVRDGAAAGGGGAV